MPVARPIQAILECDVLNGVRYKSNGTRSIYVLYAGIPEQSIETRDVAANKTRQNNRHSESTIDCILFFLQRNFQLTSL